MHKVFWSSITLRKKDHQQQILYSIIGAFEGRNHQKRTQKKKKTCSFTKTIVMCHKSITTMAKLYELHFDLLPHQHYSPDLPPPWLLAVYRPEKNAPRKLCTYYLYRHMTVLIYEILYLSNQLWCIDFLTPPTPLILPHRLPVFLESLMPLKNWCSILARCSKSSLKHSICGILWHFFQV